MTLPKGLQLQPGNAFKLQANGQWKVQELPEDVIESAVPTGNLEIMNHKTVVFKTPDGDSWAQDIPKPSVASQVASKYLQAKGHDITSQVQAIMDRPGSDKDLEESVQKFGGKVRKIVPKIQAVYEKFFEDLAKVRDSIGEADHEKIDGHHREIVNDLFDKAGSVAGLSARTLINGLGDHLDDWDPDGKAD